MIKLTKKEAEILVHRLEVPECIFEVLSETEEVSEDAVFESCRRLIGLVSSGKGFEITDPLDRLVIEDAVIGSVLEDSRSMRSLRIKIGIDRRPEPRVLPERIRPVQTGSFVYNDGGRLSAGFTGSAGDCVTRSISIATGLPYLEIYDRIARQNENQRSSKRSRKMGRTARNGVYTSRKWFKDLMIELGFQWFPTMGIGTGCKVHLKADELPKGIIIASVSRHYVAVLDGIINDTFDPSRGGRRCVYGYWKKTGGDNGKA